MLNFYEKYLRVCTFAILALQIVGWGIAYATGNMMYALAAGLAMIVAFIPIAIMVLIAIAQLIKD